MITADQRRLLALCAIETEDGRLDWSLVAREAARAGGLERLFAGQVTEKSAVAESGTAVLSALSSDPSILDQALARVDSEVDAAAAVGASLTTVLDDSYPTNLRLVPNLPPFLFWVGAPVTDSDVRSVAVVGTRDASDRGVRMAQRITRELVGAGVVVVSGLAAGIDTAAHRAVLEAGGRTIAVVGTGITRTYPKQNEQLAAEIIGAGGTVMSQFWPTSPPARWTFPRRNVTMSGVTQGTVVVEASGTSGAKMQARLALEHGKRVFLLHSLVTDQPWAAKYLSRPGAIEVRAVDDVLGALRQPEAVVDTVQSRRQLVLFDAV